MAKRDNSKGAQLGAAFKRLEAARKTWRLPALRHEEEMTAEWEKTGPDSLQERGMSWEQMAHLRRDLREVREGFGKIPWRNDHAY